MKKVTTSNLTITGKMGEPPLPEPRHVQGKLLFVSEQTRVEAYKKLGELWLAEEFEEPCPLASVPMRELSPWRTTLHEWCQDKIVHARATFERFLKTFVDNPFFALSGEVVAQAAAYSVFQEVQGWIKGNEQADVDFYDWMLEEVRKRAMATPSNSSSQIENAKQDFSRGCWIQAHQFLMYYKPKREKSS